MLTRYLELIRHLNESELKYLIIGGVAAIIYGIPRVTKDIDIAIIPDYKTIEKLLEILKNLEFGTAFITNPKKILESKVTIFEDYFRLDILTEAKGFDFNSAWEKREVISVKDINLNIVALEDLINMKKAAGRKVDLEDVLLLEKIASGEFTD